jgi:hypothetical protein
MLLVAVCGVAAQAAALTAAPGTIPEGWEKMAGRAEAYPLSASQARIRPARPASSQLTAAAVIIGQGGRVGGIVVQFGGEQDLAPRGGQLQVQQPAASGAN